MRHRTLTMRDSCQCLVERWCLEFSRHGQSVSVLQKPPRHAQRFSVVPNPPVETLETYLVTL